MNHLLGEHWREYEVVLYSNRISLEMCHRDVIVDLLRDERMGLRFAAGIHVIRNCPVEFDEMVLDALLDLKLSDSCVHLGHSLGEGDFDKPYYGNIYNLVGDLGLLSEWTVEREEAIAQQLDAIYPHLESTFRGGLDFGRRRR